MMEHALKELDNMFGKRNSEILKLRFGVSCKKPKTLEAIGRKFKISRERVRQIQNKSIRQLRGKLRYRILMEELNES